MNKTYPLVLLSLKEEYFDLMERGEKTHEFRRRFCHFTTPFVCVVYASAPCQKIIGELVCSPVIYAPVDELVHLGLQSVSYFSGVKKGFALPIMQVKRYARPISLAELREHIPHFFPPQSYYFLDKDKFTWLKEQLL